MNLNGGIWWEYHGILNSTLWCRCVLQMGIPIKKAWGAINHWVATALQPRQHMWGMDQLSFLHGDWNSTWFLKKQTCCKLRGSLLKHGMFTSFRMFVLAILCKFGSNAMAFSSHWRNDKAPFENQQVVSLNPTEMAVKATTILQTSVCEATQKQRYD